MIPILSGLIGGLLFALFALAYNRRLSARLRSEREARGENVEPQGKSVLAKVGILIIGLGLIALGVLIQLPLK